MGRNISRVKKAISIVLQYLPYYLKNPLYRYFLGYQIGKDVKIGRTIIFAKKVIIHDHVRIGDGNYFMNIPLIEIKSFSTIGNDN